MLGSNYHEGTEDSHWMSISDLMTALMVIFMFIAINYIMQVVELKYVEEDIYNALRNEFEEEIEKGEIQLGPDGTIRFNSSRDILFDVNSPKLTWSFKKKLNSFIPRYWDVIKSEKYIDFIKEIRIEGHSDTQPPVTGEDSYSFNLFLSSERANEVLLFLRKHPSFKNAPKEEKDKIEFLFTSIGFSYSRALNEDRAYTYLSDNKKVDNRLSRRVEFRIITSSGSLLNEIDSLNEE